MVKIKIRGRVLTSREISDRSTLPGFTSQKDNSLSNNWVLVGVFKRSIVAKAIEFFSN